MKLFVVAFKFPSDFSAEADSDLVRGPEVYPRARRYKNISILNCTDRRPDLGPGRVDTSSVSASSSDILLLKNFRTGGRR